MTAQRLISVARVIKGAFHEFLADNCPHLAAAISYYLLLSLFPLALAAISIFGFILRSEEVEARVTEAVKVWIPGVKTAEFVNGIITDVSDSWVAAGIVATIGLIWAGTAVFNAVRKSLNTAWGIKQPRPFFHERLMELVMMIGLGFLLLISLGLTTSFKVFGERFLDGGLPWYSIVIVTSIILAFLGFLLLYKFVPNTRVRWRHVWLGALVAAMLFEIVKNVFVWFMSNFTTYNVIYGSLGTVIALMSWTYISSLILLFCAKLTSIYPKVISSLAAEAPAEAGGKENRLKVPSPSTIFVSIALLTSGSIGALRRLILRKG